MTKTIQESPVNEGGKSPNQGSTPQTQSGNRSKVTPRRLRWSFALEGPRYWFDDSPALTHWLNVYTLLVPDNERYYIRILQRCLPRIEDPEQRKEVYAFFRQETMHGQAHGRYWQNLKAAGLPVERFTRVVGTLVYKIIEPVLPLRVHVAAVAAIEHINAFLGHIFLSRQLLAKSDPELKRLFEWHFAEEIEHKAVAHNVLSTAYPGYVTRVSGALLAVPLFFATMFFGSLYLLATDKQLWRQRTLTDMYDFWFKQGIARDTLRHIMRYLRPSFDPWDVDDSELANRVLGHDLVEEEIETPRHLYDAKSVA